MPTLNVTLADRILKSCGPITDRSTALRGPGVGPMASASRIDWKRSAISPPPRVAPDAKLARRQAVLPRRVVDGPVLADGLGIAAANLSDVVEAAGEIIRLATGHAHGAEEAIHEIVCPRCVTLDSIPLVGTAVGQSI